MTTDNVYYRRGLLEKVSRDTDQSELAALRVGSTRAAAGVRYDSIAETLDDHYSSHDGLSEANWQPHESSIDNASSQILDEIERRAISLGDLYPFRLDSDVLTYQQSESQLYEFLLCTSLSPNLTENPYYDFPRYFERIATELTANFLGANTSYCHVGWPNDGQRFKCSVMPAIEASRELAWRPDDGLPDDGPRSGDEGVDYILWKGFGCGRFIGQPFYFGQCACGNDWDTKLNDVSERFFKWFARLKVAPAKVFAVPFVIPDAKLAEVSREAGIVMDRLRLVRAFTTGDHYRSEHWRPHLSSTLSLVTKT